MDAATSTISRFLSSDSHNLKYIGISGLALVVGIDAKYALNYQQLVVNCLEDADDTLKITTLDLLYRMTNRHNVEAIVDKLLGYLRTTNISSIAVRRDLISKINSLCEQYAPTKMWQVKAMNRLYEVGAELITPELTNKFIAILSDYDREEDDQEFRTTLISTYLSILKTNHHLSDPMLQVIAWILGEYCQTIESKKQGKIIKYLCEAVYQPLDNDLTKCYLLTAITKVHMAMNFDHNPMVDVVMDDFS